jgi:hypothetical protein
VTVEVNIPVGIIVDVCVLVGVGVLVDGDIKVGPNNCPGSQEDIKNIAIIIIEATFIFIAPPTQSRVYHIVSNRKAYLCNSA